MAQQYLDHSKAILPLTVQILKGGAKSPGLSLYSGIRTNMISEKGIPC
jgi:hypothetical protein